MGVILKTSHFACSGLLIVVVFAVIAGIGAVLIGALAVARGQAVVAAATVLLMLLLYIDRVHGLAADLQSTSRCATQFRFRR